MNEREKIVHEALISLALAQAETISGRDEVIEIYQREHSCLLDAIRRSDKIGVIKALKLTRERWPEISDDFFDGVEELLEQASNSR